MTHDILSRAIELEREIEFFNGQIETIKRMENDNEFEKLSIGCQLAIPNGMPRMAVLAILKSAYEDMLLKDRMEYEML